MNHLLLVARGSQESAGSKEGQPPAPASAPGPPAASTSTRNDEWILERVLAGDVEQFGQLVDRYQDRLYRHALGMALDGDTAADLVQDAFVKAYANLSNCRDRARFGTWLFTILRNRCLDHLKQRRRKDWRLDEYTELPAGDDDPDDRLERWALRDTIDGALTELPPAYREAFLLKHVHDLTYEEMAEIVGASVSALRMRVLRAREMLRSLIPRGIEGPPSRM